ncbi:MAG: SBBP repeat-containing protein [Terracidiphilus sp.]
MGFLCWSFVAAVLLLFGCAARGQGSLSTSASAKPPGNDAKAAAVRVSAAAHFARLPLSFEANRGQADRQVKFLSRGPGYTLFLTQREAVFAFASPARSGRKKPKPHASALRIRFEGGKANASISGTGELPGKTNYFPSGDRTTWQTNIPNYSRVDYENLYPGVNAVFHGDPQRLEFDFDVAPGANPSNIALDIAGGRALRLDKDGNIILRVSKSSRGGEVTLGKPAVYQQIAGVRREIASRFVLRGRHRIGFALGSYDRTRPLVIDPTLSYSTYLGAASGGTNLTAIAVDSSGSAYVAGGTNATTFPTPTGMVPVGLDTTIVVKFTPDGSALDYVAFLPSGTIPQLVVDGNGSAYVSEVYGGNYTVGGGYQNPNAATYDYNNSLTVIKLSADGSSVVYAAQIGPVNPGPVGLLANIAVDGQDSAYVVSGTNSSYFSTTANAYLPTLNGCSQNLCDEEATVTKLSADGSSLVYSTFLGGTSDLDQALAVAVDSLGDAYVTGITASSDFPITSGAFETACPAPDGTPNCGWEPAFVTKLNPAGSALLYSTYFGYGITDFYAAVGTATTSAISVDAAGNAYVAGVTNASAFGSSMSPLIIGPVGTCEPNPSSLYSCGATEDLAFLGKISSDGTKLTYLATLGNYVTPLAGSSENGANSASSVAVDSSGHAYLTGTTASSFFPVTSDAYQSTQLAPCNSQTGCGDEAIFSILDTTVGGNASLVYSTYLGATPVGVYTSDTGGFGIATDASGSAYLAGNVTEGNFQTTPGVFQTSCAPESIAGCSGSGFIVKFGPLATSAAAIAAVSGGGQSATIGKAFANPLVVKVTDASGNPVSGVTVTFTAPSSGASASLSTAAPTASDGTTSVTATANGIASSSAYQVSATVVGVTTPATFSLTNTQAATSLVVTPSGFSLVYGQMVTINAAISPASVLTSTPTGSVAFYDGATALTPDSAVSGAAGSYTVNVPTVGSHTYSAQYLGDTNFAESALTNATPAVVVNKASVTLTGPATQPVRVQAGSAGSIPVTIAGQYTGSGIATPSGGLSYSVSGNAFGPGSLLVANGMASVPVPSTVPAGTYTVTVSYAGDLNYNSNSIGIQLVVYPALSIGPATLPAGIVGGAYSQALAAKGGSDGGYTWAVQSGTALSAVRLSLSAGGVISGTPNAAETGASFTVEVTDSQGDTATQAYQLTIYPSLTITPATVPVGVVDRSYSQQLTATGGSGSNYQWGVTSGTALSAVGLTLSTAGVISGKPSAPETAAAFTVDVVDSLGNVTTMTYHLTINPALSITQATLPAGTVGTAYSQTLTATGGSGSGYTFAVTAGTALSAVNLTLSPSGAITGTPKGPETAAAVTVQVTDSLGDIETQNYALTINSPSAESACPTGWVCVNDPETVAVNDSLTQVQLNVISDPETITVNDSATQVQIIDVSDPETVTVTDIPQVTVIDFKVSLSAPPNLVLLPGQSVSFPFVVSPANGAFSGTIDFTMSGLPPSVTATFDPSTVTLGNTSQTVTVTLTAAPLQARQRPARRSGEPSPFVLALFLPLIVPFFGLGHVRRKLRRGGWLVLLALLSFVALAGMNACASSGFFNQSPQTYKVTLTATSGTVQHSTTFNLTVE